MKTNKTRYRIELNIKFRKLLFRSEFEQFLIIHWQETYKITIILRKSAEKQKKDTFSSSIGSCLRTEKYVKQTKKTQIHTHTLTLTKAKQIEL